MAMSVGGDSAEEKPMSDINTTPLVDVMLVLLIIFLIAIPVAIQSVELELPTVAFEPNETKPENILLAIRGNPTNNNCEVFWGMSPINSTDLLKRGSDKLKAIVDRLGDNITPEDVPEVHIRGDVNTPYRCVGGGDNTEPNDGFVNIRLVSKPKPSGQ